jgi:hypothetical protein
LPFTVFDNGIACPPDCVIDGTLTLADPLPADFSGLVDPTSFSFSVGPGGPTFDETTTINDGTAPEGFLFLTDDSGVIYAWSIDLPNAAGNLLTTDLAGDMYQVSRDPGPSQAALNGDHGTWTVSTSQAPPAETPEPSTVWLLAGGLLSLGVVAVRRKRLGWLD